MGKETARICDGVVGGKYPCSRTVGHAGVCLARVMFDKEGLEKKMAEKCTHCNGTGMLKVPRKRVKAVVTTDAMSNDWQQTIAYVPTDVYAVRQCPFCEGTHRPKPRKKEPESLELPDVGVMDIGKNS